MTKPTIDANAISDRAEPLTQHPAHEMQPYAALLPLQIGLLDKKLLSQGITQASSFVPLSRLAPDSYAHIASRPSLRRPRRQRVLKIPL